MKLLIIRPEPGAGATAQRAEAEGFEPQILPFFEIRARPWSVPNDAGFDALLLTSANAARHAGPGLDRWRTLPVHCVGDRSAVAARLAGLNVVSVGKTDGAEVIEAAERAGHRHMLWLAGDDHRSLEFPASMTTEIAIVYASVQLPLPDDAAHRIAAADAVALHSPRAAAAFAAAVDALGLDRKHILIAAFSSAIARAAGDGWRGVAIAGHPADSAMLSALAELGKQVSEFDCRKDSV